MLGDRWGRGIVIAFVVGAALRSNGKLQPDHVVGSGVRAWMSGVWIGIPTKGSKARSVKGNFALCALRF